MPGKLPPDQLIFEHLYNLPAADDFWKNNLQFTRDVFTNNAAEVIGELGVSGNTVDVNERVKAYKRGKKQEDKKQEDKKLREMFKRFYNGPDFRKLVTSSAKPYNPWKHWGENNPDAVNEFLTQFKEALNHTMKSGYAVDAAKLDFLEVKLKGV